jgi:hypothetical protein
MNRNTILMGAGIAALPTTWLQTGTIPLPIELSSRRSCVLRDPKASDAFELRRELPTIKLPKRKEQYDR